MTKPSDFECFTGAGKWANSRTLQDTYKRAVSEALIINFAMCILPYFQRINKLKNNPHNRISNIYIRILSRSDLGKIRECQEVRRGGKEVGMKNISSTYFSSV